MEGAETLAGAGRQSAAMRGLADVEAHETARFSAVDQWLQPLALKYIVLLKRVSVVTPVVLAGLSVAACVLGALSLDHARADADTMATLCVVLSASCFLGSAGFMWAITGEAVGAPTVNIAGIDQRTWDTAATSFSRYSGLAMALAGMGVAATLMLTIGAIYSKVSPLPQSDAYIFIVGGIVALVCGIVLAYLRRHRYQVLGEMTGLEL